MEHLDTNEYLRRAKLVDELANRHPEHLAELPPLERTVIETYFLGALSASDADEYRHDYLKREPRIELQANKAYEHFLSLAGIPVMLV
jgi:hypothetical protein